MATYHPEGKFKGTITGQAVVKSKTKGTPGIALEFLLNYHLNRETGEYEPYECEHTQVIELWCTEKTIDGVLDFIQKCGFTGTDPSQINLSHPQARSVVGNEIEVENRHEESKENGNVYDRWRIPFQGREPVVADQGATMQLTAMFGPAFKRKFAKSAAPKPAARPATRHAVAGAEQAADDDTPF